VAPNQVVDFITLYTQNCAACHGADGRGGASIALANPVYLAIVDENAMHKVVANGVRGTSMPAFAQSARIADRRTDQCDHQRNFVTLGTQGNSRRTNPPFYAAKTGGNVDHGKTRLWNILRILPRFEAEGRLKPAPSRMIHFWRWSAIRTADAGDHGTT